MRARQNADAVTPAAAAWLREAAASVMWLPGKVTVRVVSGDRTLVFGSGATFAEAFAEARSADERWRRYVATEAPAVPDIHDPADDDAPIRAERAPTRRKPCKKSK